MRKPAKVVEGPEERARTRAKNPKRKFSAEITFAGLCLLRFRHCDDFHEGEAGPRTAGEVEVLLVSTPNDSSSHDHVPRLNYFLEDDMTTELGRQLVPAPDGRQIVSIEIAKHDIAITPPFDYDRKHPRSKLKWMRAGRRSDSPRVPKHPREDAYLDWILDTREFDLADIDPNRSATRIKVPNGEWSCAGIARNREVPTLRPLRWQLVDKNGVPARGSTPRALGTDVRLRLENLRYGPVIELRPRDGGEPSRIQLTPGSDDVVRVSITNLPVVVGPSEEGHLPMYKDIAPGSPELHLRQADQLSCNPWRPCYAAMRFERS